MHKGLSAMQPQIRIQVICHSQARAEANGAGPVARSSATRAGAERVAYASPPSRPPFDSTLSRSGLGPNVRGSIDASATSPWLRAAVPDVVHCLLCSEFELGMIPI